MQVLVAELEAVEDVAGDRLGMRVGTRAVGAGCEQFEIGAVEAGRFFDPTRGRY